MPAYRDLVARFRAKRVALLDGAVGTQLQEMGVPMDNTAWAALALKDYPATVQRMHELYLEAGADVITTNTYSSARHNLEPLGLGHLTAELNLRAVMLAQQARERAAKGRPVWIAGAISGFGITTSGEPQRSLHRYANPRSAITADQAQANLAEQARLLAEAGVDFLLIEGTGENAHRRWMIEACRSTGLPVWLGFRCRLDQAGSTVRIGYSSTKRFDVALDEVLADDLAGVSVFHSSIAAVAPALAILKRKWRGPIAVYPEADRHDYTATWHDPNEKNAIGAAEFVAHAKTWIGEGAAMVGGCCGLGVPYIRALAAALGRDARPARKARRKRGRK
jgi:5-methyltetrahydrofolate--homocysteine methyltransferase